MNQETILEMQVTLDTSVLVEYWQEQKKRAVVERLLALAEVKDIDLAITAGAGGHSTRTPSYQGQHSC